MYPLQKAGLDLVIDVVLARFLVPFPDDRITAEVSHCSIGYTAYPIPVWMTTLPQLLLEEELVQIPKIHSEWSNLINWNRTMKNWKGENHLIPFTSNIFPEKVILKNLKKEKTQQKEGLRGMNVKNSNNLPESFLIPFISSSGNSCLCRVSD